MHLNRDAVIKLLLYGREREREREREKEKERERERKRERERERERDALCVRGRYVLRCMLDNEENYRRAQLARVDETLFK
jgi:hypothetical protein